MAQVGKFEVLNAAQFKLAFQEHVRQTGRDANKELRKQQSLLIGDLIRYTPPPSVGITPGAAKKMGEKAIEADLRKIFATANPRAIELWKKRFGESKVTHTARTGSRRGGTGGTVLGSDKVIFNPTGAGMAQHHAKYRRKSDGRVTTAGTRDITIGRWKFVEKMYVPMTSFRNYLKLVQSHVGRAKAGWNASGRRFGVNPAREWPAWVRRHAGAGAAVDTLGTGTKGYLEAVNTNTAAYRANFTAGIVSRALRARAIKIKTEMNRILEARAARFNARRT